MRLASFHLLWVRGEEEEEEEEGRRKRRLDSWTRVIIEKSFFAYFSLEHICNRGAKKIGEDCSFSYSLYVYMYIEIYIYIPKQVHRYYGYG